MRTRFSRWVELLGAFASKDIKTRYHSVALGSFYAFGVSLITMAVLGAAFGRLLGGRMRGPYPLYLFSGLIAWNFLSFSTNQAIESFRSAAAIVRKVPFPKELVPLGVVAANALNMCMSLVAFVPVALVLGLRPAWTWTAIPLAVVLLVLFVAGIAMLVAAACLFYLDLKPVIEVAVMIWFYATPVIYPREIVPERFSWALRLNPMTHVLDLFRALMVEGRWPDARTVGVVVATAVVAVFCGWTVIKKIEGVVADRVA